MSTRLLFFILFITFPGGVTFSQSSEIARGKMLCKEQALEDYNMLYSSLINYHPAPYFYTSESEIKAFYENQKNQLTDSIREMDLVILCRNLVAQIKCGHTVSIPSDAWFSSMQGLENKLPFEIKYIDGRIFIAQVVEDTFDLKVNDELLRINDRSAIALFEEMVKMESGDGFTASFRNALVEKRFVAYTLFLLGIPNEFLIEYKNQAREIKQFYVKPTARKASEIQAALVPENLQLVQENKWSKFHYDPVSHLAYLKINNFGEKKEYKKYYKEVFKFLKKDSKARLILDLRDNPGGDFRHGNRFLTYVTPDQFNLNFERPRAKRIENDYVKYNFWDKLVKLAFAIKPPRYKEKGQITETITYKPKKNVFTGKIAVITNGITFSQAALVSAQLRANGAIFFGQETGGAELGCNGMLTYKLFLPNSGIKVSIPAYHVKSNSSTGKVGFGVIPDYPIAETLNRNNDDTLNEVIRIILNEMND